MSERKVLNKYYPPDFDPSKIPRGKRNKNATFNIRIMAPFNMRCNMCKEYIYKGKKFNSRKEDVMDEFYLGLRIFRFYIKCPRCVSEIAFKTDLVNTDYTLEAGATRLFEAEKIAMKMAEQEQKEKEDAELNPMVVLENRTKASRAEMDQIDSLEEIREMNTRKNVVNKDEMIEKYRKYEQLLLELQIEQEEVEIKEIFGEKGGQTIKRLHDSDSDDDGGHVVKKLATGTDVKPTDILAQEPVEVKKKKPEVWQKSVGSLSSKANLKGLIVKKKSSLPTMSSTVQKDTTKSDIEKSVKKTALTSPKWNFSEQTLNSPLAQEASSIDTKTVNKDDSNTERVTTQEVKRSTTDVSSKQSSPTQVKPTQTSTGNLLGLAYSDSDSESDN